MLSRGVGVALTLVLLGGGGMACTNFLVPKGTTDDGSTIISYAADEGALFGKLQHLPAADHPKGAMRDIWDWDSGVYLGQIPEASHTYNVVGNMNEHRLAIGETTFGGLKALSNQPGALIDYGSLIWITLQRAKTAREAIKTMDALVQQYGYYSTGESFSIADPDEVWLMELIGKGPGEKGAVWVARRVPDGSVCAHANQARIRTWPRDDPDNNMWSADVVSFARKKGLYPNERPDEEFSFSDVYDPITFFSARLGEARAWELLRAVAEPGFGERYLDYVQGKNLTNRMPLFVKSTMKVSLNQTMWLMRSHYDGTWFDEANDVGAGPFHARYRRRPLMWEYKGNHYVNERSISTQQTGWHFVAHIRGWLPKEVGGVLWFGVDDTGLSAHFPAYGSVTSVPATWSDGDASHFQLRSAFWIFNVVANFVYTHWSDVFPEVESKIAMEEANFFLSVKSTDMVATNLLKNNNTAEAIAFLTNFSNTCGDSLVDTWIGFWGYLFAKYRDGFVVTQPPPKHPKDKPVPNCASPGYDDAWKARIVEDAGWKYLAPNSSSGPDLAHAMWKLQFIK